MSSDLKLQLDKGEDSTGEADFPQEKKESAGQTGMWDSLRNRDYRYLWVGNLCSSFAMNMQMVARGWLVYAMTSSPAKLAWVTISFMLPQVLFALFGGVLADRFTKKKIIAIAQTMNCAATLIMAYIIFSGSVAFIDFLVFGFFNGTVLALSMPARTSYIPELVGENLLFNAMALSTTSMNLSRILGPAVAGILIAILASGDTTSTFGVGVVYFVIAALYFLSACTITFVSVQGSPIRRSTQHPLKDIKDGLDYVRGYRLLTGLILLSIIPFLFGMGISSLMPAFNEEVIHGGPDDLGMLMGFMGAGAILGSLLLARMSEVGRKGRLLLIIIIFWSVSIMVFSMTDSLLVSIAVVSLVGFFSSLFMAMNRGLIQLVSSQEMRGRVMSIDLMAHGLMPLGILPVSYIAELYGVEWGILCSGLMLAVCGGFLMYVFPQLRAIDRGN